MSARAPAAQANSLADENLAVFGAQAYRDLKRHVVEVNHARAARRAYAQTGTWSNKPVEAQSIMRVAGWEKGAERSHTFERLSLYLSRVLQVPILSFRSSSRWDRGDQLSSRSLEEWMRFS